MSRILVNWVLRRFGVPFVVALCSTPAQRKQYIDAIKAAFRPGKPQDGPPDDLDIAPTRLMADLVAEHCGRAWTELGRLHAQVTDCESL